MAEYFIGNVRQAAPESSVLSWQVNRPKTGNDLKISSLSEADCNLPCAKLHISFPVRGTEYYRVDGELIRVRPGEYLMLNAGQAARIEWRQTTAVDGICIFLAPETIREAAHGHDTSIEAALLQENMVAAAQPEFPVKNYKFEENTLGHVLRNLTPQLLDSAPLIDWDDFYFHIAGSLWQTHRGIQQQLLGLPAANAATKQEIYKRMSRAHHYLLDNFEKPVSLDDLAKTALLSRFHVARLYRQLYGISPHRHLLHLRIERAKHLLQQGNSPTEVACRLSFSDRRSFAKVFRRLTGKTPAEHR